MNTPGKQHMCELCELLEALKLVRLRLWVRRTKFTDDDHAAMNAASAVIAKAEGRA